MGLPARIDESSRVSQVTTLVAAPAEERSRALPGGAGVPWRTVLPLAVVLAYADGFWITSLRGAVGAIERTQSPFTDWVRESTLSLPVFVLAVLGALTLAMHWYGSSAHRPRWVLVSALLVVAAGTLAGVAELTASSAYDYHLQLHQDFMMGTMRQTCTGPCLAKADDASFWIQVRAVGWGSLILLVTNLVLVGWAAAFFGGRLKVSTTRGAGLAAGSRADNLRLLLVAGLVGSAVIHAAVVPEHRTEWAAAGAFFVLLTAAEVAVAALLMARTQATVLLAAAAVSAGPLLLWLSSRTAGLPFGPEAGTPEAVGLADCAACLLEIVTLVLSVVLLRGVGWTRRPAASSTHLVWLGLVAVVAVTAIGLAGTELSWFDVVGSTMAHAG